MPPRGFLWYATVACCFNDPNELNPDHRVSRRHFDTDADSKCVTGHRARAQTFTTRGKIISLHVGICALIRMMIMCLDSNVFTIKSDRLEMTWKESILICFNVHSRHSHEGTEDIPENMSESSRCPSQDTIKVHPVYKPQALSLDQHAPSALCWQGIKEMNFYIPFTFSFKMALPAHSGPSPLIQYRNHFSQTLGLLGWVISPLQGRYLNTGQHKHRINAYTHQIFMSRVGVEPTIPASEWENRVHALVRPRGHCDRQSIYFMVHWPYV
jgi:hypothetical protein